MSHQEPPDHLAEQAALYALGSLDAEETRRFEVHLAEGCQVCYMLGGTARLDGQSLEAGDFYRAAAGTAHEVSWTETGCAFLLITSSVEILA